LGNLLHGQIDVRRSVVGHRENPLLSSVLFDPNLERLQFGFGLPDLFVQVPTGGQHFFLARLHTPPHITLRYQIRDLGRECGLFPSGANLIHERSRPVLDARTASNAVDERREGIFLLPASRVHQGYRAAETPQNGRDDPATYMPQRAAVVQVRRVLGLEHASHILGQRATHHRFFVRLAEQHGGAHPEHPGPARREAELAPRG